MIQPYLEYHPLFGRNVRIHDFATVMGQVELGDDVSVWPSCVLRGDLNLIRIGTRTNIQDGCVFHTDRACPTLVGQDCVIGHQACVHACQIGNRCLVGIHSTILTGAQIGDECVIGAGAVVPEGKVIPPRSLVLGLPGRFSRQVTDEDVRKILKGVEEYMVLARQLPPV